MIVPCGGDLLDLRIMKNIITLALLTFAISAKAQVAEIVASGGGKLAASSISIEYTIGDIAVGTFDGSSTDLFEGFQAINYGIGLITGLYSETVFSFYPNPTQKFLTIEADFSPGSTFHVTDMSGKQLQLPSELQAHKAVVDVSSLPSALYVLTIQEKSGISHRVKFIKAL